LNKLQLESLELRRLRLDLIFVYKLVFGLTDLNLNEFFKLHTDYTHRGRKYKICKKPTSLQLCVRTM